MLGFTVGYAINKLTLEVDYSFLETATGFSINPSNIAGNSFGFGGGSSITGGFSRLGLQAKYNLLNNTSFMRISPIVGAGLILSDLDPGIFMNGQATSGSNGITTFASIEETAYTGNTSVQLSLGAEFGFNISTHIELYLNYIYSIGTSDVLTTDISYELNTPEIENLTSSDLEPGLLREKAVLANNFTMFQTALGIRFRFGSTKKQAEAKQ